MNPFYKTKKWEARRARVLRRDEYLCRECRRYGKSTPATTVHHVIPLAWCCKHSSALALASANLLSLCEECHNRMHDRGDNGKLTALGRAWVKRMGEIGKAWIKKYSGEG